MSTCEHSERLESDILGVLNAYLDPKDLQGLLSDLNEAEAFEEVVLRQPKSPSTNGSNGNCIAGEKLDHLITFLQAVVSEEERCDALLEIGNTFKRHGDLHRAEEVFTRILNTAVGSGDRGYIGEAYLGRGEVYGLLGRWKHSTADLKRSRMIFTRMKEHASLGRVENVVGTGLAEQGKLREARTHFRRALTMFEQADEGQMTGMVLMNLGIIQNIMGQYDVALVHYNRAKPYFEGTGNLCRLAELHHNMGMSYAMKGSILEAFREFDISIGLGTRVGNMNLLGLAMLGKAHVLYRQRDFSMALKLIAQAMGAFRGSSDRLSLADAYKLRGMVHRELGKLRYAEVCLKTSLRINEELGNRLNIGETSLEIGLLEARRCRNAEAMNAFHRALHAFKQVGAARDAARVECLMNKIGKGTHATQ